MKKQNVSTLFGKIISIPFWNDLKQAYVFNRPGKNDVLENEMMSSLDALMSPLWDKNIQISADKK